MFIQKPLYTLRMLILQLLALLGEWTFRDRAVDSTRVTATNHPRFWSNIQSRNVLYSEWFILFPRVGRSDRCASWCARYSKGAHKNSPDPRPKSDLYVNCDSENII